MVSRSFKDHFGYFIQGFRKVDTDRWEFANEAFQRGKRPQLKNIQRRKSPQSQQIGIYVGPSTEAGRPVLEGEIEMLRKEKSELMQEVVELQQQQRGTIHHMGAVNERLQSAEQRQKQMVSFLAKLLQNPAFLARLQQKKEQREIGSPRVRRKFVKQPQHGMGTSDSSMEGQIVKYQPDWRHLSIPAVGSDLNPVPVEQSQDSLTQGMVNAIEPMGLGAESILVASDELAMSDELPVLQGFRQTSEQWRGGSSRMGTEDLKGKSVVSPQEEVDPEYFVSFPEEMTKEKSFSELSPRMECIMKQEDIWSVGFDTGTGMPAPSNQLWGNPINYEVPEFGVTDELSDMWDLGSLQAAEGLGMDKWTTDESPSDEPESQDRQPEDYISKNRDP